jgi:hypothetical protein
VLSSLLGLTNWQLIANGNSYFTHLGRPPFVQHLWSVAVEIQFYLLCPWLVGWLVRRRRTVALSVVGAAVVASGLLMGALAHGADPSRAYYGTDTRAGALLMGTFLALLLTRHGHKGVARRTARGSRLIGPIALASLVTLVLTVGERSRGLYPLGFFAAELLVALLIAASLRPGWLSKILGRPGMRWLGQRSYGIYLWHWPVVIMLRPRVDVAWSAMVTVPLTIALSLVLGELSFRLVERPFLRPRRPVSQRRVLIATRRISLTTACIALAIVLVRLPTSDNIADSLRAGEHVLATSPFATVTAAATPPTSAASTSSSQPAFSAVSKRLGTGSGRASSVARYSPHLSAPAPGTVPVTAVGDSVMLGAANALQSRLGSSGHIDAKVGRQFDEGIRVIRSLREQGRLGRVVVVHLGNNGPVKASQIDALMGELDAVPHVLLVTVRVDAAWQNSVNQTMHDAAARYSKVTLVDWFSYSTGHSDWFWSDNTHLRPAGANAYADLVAGSVPPPPPPPPPPSTTTTSHPPPSSTTTSTTAPPPSSTTTSTTSSTTTSTTLLAP